MRTNRKVESGDRFIVEVGCYQIIWLLALLAVDAIRVARSKACAPFTLLHLRCAIYAVCVGVGF